MPVRKTITLFTYDELSDAAKQKARDNEQQFQLSLMDKYLRDVVENDFVPVAKMFGLKFRDAHKRWPGVWWSIKDKPDDYVDFDGWYSYEENALPHVKEFDPTDTRLHDIVSRLTNLQAAYSHTLLGTFDHKNTLSPLFVSRWDGDDGPWEESLDHKDTEVLQQIFIDFKIWMRDRLQEEFRFCQSKEFLEYEIQEKGYLFNEKGTHIPESMLFAMKAEDV